MSAASEGRTEILLEALRKIAEENPPKHDKFGGRMTYKQFARTVARQAIEDFNSEGDGDGIHN